MAKSVGVKDDLFCIKIASEWMALRLQKGAWRSEDMIDAEDRMFELEGKLIKRYGTTRGRELIDKMKSLVYQS